MGIRIETRIIGNAEYEVHQMGFRATRETFVRLCNIMGPSFVSLVKELIAATAKSKTKVESVEAFMSALGSVDISRAADVLGAFLGKLSDADLEYLTNAFAGANGMQSRYKPAGSNGFMPLSLENRELHFGGDGFVEYFQWLAFALEVNYRGFFSGASGLPEVVRALKRADTDEK